MTEQDFEKIAPQGLEDLTSKVHTHLAEKTQAICENCGADNRWVFKDLAKTNVYGTPGRTVWGPLIFNCNNCHKQTRIIKLTDVGLRGDIKV
jgi:hypothetical protein